MKQPASASRRTRKFQTTSGCPCRAERFRRAMSLSTSGRGGTRLPFRTHVRRAGRQEDHVALFVPLCVPLTVELELELALVEDVNRPPCVVEGDCERRHRCATENLLTAKSDAS